jgi:hypothetical protein
VTTKGPSKGSGAKPAQKKPGASGESSCGQGTCASDNKPKLF